MKKSASNTNGSSSNYSKNNQNSKMENKNTPAQAGAPKTVFTYEKKTVNPSSVQIHPMLLATGQAVSNDIFVDFYNEFNFLETPVMTEDGFAITHAGDVAAAQHLGLGTIDVVVMKNATEENVIRFISFTNVISHGKNKTALCHMIEYLTDHLKNTESGKQWASEFKTNKTRSIVAEIIGCSTGKIQGALAISKAKPELLGKIDRGEITADKAIQQIKATNTVPFVSRKRYEDVAFSSKNKNDAPRFNLNSLVLKYESLGEFNLVVSDTSVSGSLNGVSLGEMSQSILSDYESSGSSQSQHVQTHTFLPVNDRFCIQVIIRDLDQLEDGQMAIAA